MVLRKQKLIFLHLFHHIMALLYVWYGYSEQASNARWKTNINLFVQSFMYSYYTLKAFKLYIPKQFQMLITFLQIIQMAVGFYVDFYVLQRKLAGFECHVTYKITIFGMLFYYSLFIFYIKIFIKYFDKKKLHVTFKLQ